MNLVFNEKYMFNIQKSFYKSIITIYSKNTFRVYEKVFDSYMVDEIYKNLHNIELHEYDVHIDVMIKDKICLSFDFMDFYNICESTLNSLFSFYENI